MVIGFLKHHTHYQRRVAWHSPDAFFLCHKRLNIMGPGRTIMRGSCICVVLLLLESLMRSNTGLTAEPRASRMLSDDSKAICKMLPSP